MRINKTGEAASKEIDDLIHLMPDDRVRLYKNVISNPVGDLPRYSIHIRIQHMLTFVTFLALAFTGLPVAFYDHFWAEPLNTLIGGVDVSRIIHRTLAVAMILTMIYHIFTVTIAAVKCRHLCHPAVDPSPGTT